MIIEALQYLGPIGVVGYLSIRYFMSRRVKIVDEDPKWLKELKEAFVNDQISQLEFEKALDEGFASRLLPAAVEKYNKLYPKAVEKYNPKQNQEAPKALGARCEYCGVVTGRPHLESCKIIEDYFNAMAGGTNAEKELAQVRYTLEVLKQDIEREENVRVH